MYSDITKVNNIEIPSKIIDETEKFFRGRGKLGYEAKVYWICSQVYQNKATICKLFIPKQIARKSLLGVSVEVPDEGNLELIRNLGDNEVALVKLHTHPRAAYLSDVDIQNPFFRHEGAISIVVPNFCSQPLRNLTDCSVNIFKSGNWKSLKPDEIKRLFSIKG